eukprot:763625-Hanusia_phi.AAC.3
MAAELAVPLQRSSPPPARHRARVHPAVVERIPQLRAGDSSGGVALARWRSLDAHPDLVAASLNTGSSGDSGRQQSTTTSYFDLGQDLLIESWLGETRFQLLWKADLGVNLIERNQQRKACKGEPNFVLSKDLLKHPVLVCYRLKDGRKFNGNHGDWGEPEDFAHSRSHSLGLCVH